MKARQASATFVALPTMKQLRDFVRRRLCEHDRLEPSETPLLEAPVRRAGRVCGLFFEIEGPRLLRAHAIWASDEHRLLFYDSSGARFAEVRLTESPALDSSLPQAA